MSVMSGRRSKIEVKVTYKNIINQLQSAFIIDEKNWDLVAKKLLAIEAKAA